MATGGTTTSGDHDRVIAELQRQLQDLQSHYESELKHLSGRMDTEREVNVQVQPPPSLPKLKVFTGLPATSTQETSFEAWKRQASEVNDDVLVIDKVGLLKRSLKGAAHEHVRGKNYATVDDLIKDLDKLFGELKSAEEMYLELCQSRMMKTQTKADFLMTLSTKMKEVQKTAGFSNEEYQRRLYYAFSKGLIDSLFALELRNKFGMPGDTKPAFSDLYRYVRQIEGLEVGKQKAQVGAHAAPSPPPDFTQERTEAPQQQGRRKIYCYKCGENGHFYRDCTKPANAHLVVQKEQDRRRQENEWRRRKGLPELPLN
ncbi:paraneoplastic antigen Ma3 homolog [Littorina saxatilis]|uniref:paraneoplastic antigen Ma3 homolog n=1 Tax=Littorina saxatilis TaxID=31220 RepID=UPI0038B64BC6